jgi:hypothetical protein
MPGVPDIGGYFDKLTQRGRGGSRLDGDAGRAATPEASSTDRPSMGKRLRDAAARTVERARSTATGSPAARQRSAGNVVTIEYTPALDDDPDPGEVVWVWVPFEEDPTQGKDRPVVVIGRRGTTLVGVPLTSKQHDDEPQVNVGTGAWDSKRRTSYARIWRMLDVDPGEMRREGAVLERDRFDKVVEAVDQYYDIRRVETTNRSRRQQPVDDEDF